MASKTRRTLTILISLWTLRKIAFACVLLLLLFIVVKNIPSNNDVKIHTEGLLKNMIEFSRRDVDNPTGGIEKVEQSQPQQKPLPPVATFQNSSMPGKMPPYDFNNPVYLKALHKLGLERIETHSFKSPYIINPAHYHILNERDIAKAPGVREKKIISLHHIRFQDWFWSFNTVNRDFKRCPYSECEVDLHGTQAHKAAIVVFLCKGQTDPPPRQPGQLWALFCWEAEPHWRYPRDIYDKVWKDGVNIMMGYRLGSEHFTPYLKLAWRDSSLLYSHDKYVEIAKTKVKTATIFVSNCRSDRLNYLRRMQKYIDIDIWGKCGTLKCPRDHPEVCMNALNTTYKFYLSFENTFCADYSSNKMHRAFINRAHIIPVVKGGFDHDRYMPPGLLVDGNKFGTAKELALYLKDLGNDYPRYATMLQEKDKLEALPQEHADWCMMCEQVHTGKFPPRHDIARWTHGNTCRPSEYLPKPGEK